MPPVRSKASSSFWRSWKGVAVAAAVIAVVAASFVLPGAFGKKSSSASASSAELEDTEPGRAPRAK